MIAIVDYDAGNLTSVKRALDYLGVTCEITPDAGTVRKSKQIIFPGVGHAKRSMLHYNEYAVPRIKQYLHDRGIKIRMLAE